MEKHTEANDVQRGRSSVGLSIAKLISMLILSSSIFNLRVGLLRPCLLAEVCMKMQDRKNREVRGG